MFRLSSNPYLGKGEELLCTKGKVFRSLVEGHYKIIYYIEFDTIIILAFFDCRQDPLKLSNDF